MFRSVRFALLVVVFLCACSKKNTPTDPGGGGGGGGGGNRNPTVNLNISTTHLAVGGNAGLTVTATDPDGDQVTFTWSATLGTVTTSGPTSTTATYQAGSQWGQATVTVTASDGKGGTAQATAQTYIRNPNPPGFTFSAAGSANCGYGTPNPEGFILQLTPNEAILVTTLTIRPRQCPSSCGTTRNYATTPLSLASGQAYLWSDGSCNTPTCCENQGCGNCGYWTVIISGRRPEPDGGTFSFQCYSWNPSFPSNFCN